MEHFELTCYYVDEYKRIVVQVEKKTACTVVFFDRTNDRKFIANMKHFDELGVELRGDIRVYHADKVANNYKLKTKNRPIRLVTEIKTYNKNVARIYKRLKFDPCTEYEFTCSIYDSQGHFIRSIGGDTSIAHLKVVIRELSSIQMLIESEKKTLG